MRVSIEHGWKRMSKQSQMPKLFGGMAMISKPSAARLERRPPAPEGTSKRKTPAFCFYPDANPAIIMRIVMLRLCEPSPRASPLRRGRGSLLRLVGLLWVFCATLLQGAEVVDWQAGEGFRSRELKLPSTGRTFLERLPPASTGVVFTNVVSQEKALENSLLASGSGVAAGDVDGDGWCDLYFCGMENRNALYRNLGNWRFEDVTASAGVACDGQYSTGAVFADVDG